MEFGLMLVGVELMRLRDLAQTAQALGFDLLTFPDHLLLEQPGGNYDPRALRHDPFVSAAVAAEATTKIKLGHLVLCNPFRHPAITAQALASLDHLSGGRLIAGLGAGWTAREFAMFGLSFPPAPARLRMLDESLTVMRSLWSGEATTFAGEFYHLREAILWPAPAQKPHPPILVGGSGRGLLRVAAKHADIVNIIVELGRVGRMTTETIDKLTAERFTDKVRFVREQARQAGRDPGALAISNSIFAARLVDSPAAARKEAAAIAGAIKSNAAAVLASPLFLIGTPEEAAAELSRRARQWGVSQFVFGGMDEATTRRLAEQVLAPLRA
jgi:probable F420-dependent oxidoreductase